MDFKIVFSHKKVTLIKKILLIYITSLLWTNQVISSNITVSKRGGIITKKSFFLQLPPECIQDRGAIDDFPDDYFTQEQRASGYVLIHLLISVYIFILLALICEGYFVPSLGYISQVLKLSGDVAGATFMAIGSSAPTVFIALISVFLLDSATDIGVGTIVGSTIFNTLFIIGSTCFSINGPITIMWYPLLRDSIAYLTSTSALIITVSNGRVDWWEALSFIVIYVIYILTMVKNKQIEKLAYKIHSNIMRIDNHSNNTCTNNNNISDIKTSIDHYDEIEFTIFKIPLGIFNKIKWFFGLFIVLFFDIVTPKCMSQNKASLYYILRFLISIVFLGLFSYILVWMVCIIGFTFGIPDCVMGMTFLAAGSSLPDVMASVVVARKGNADMSIANAVGSNVFDMLCLGLPWFLMTAIIHPNSHIEIHNQSARLSAGLLVGSMLYTVSTLYLNNWTLSKKLGFMFIASYLSIITLTVVVEMLSCPCDLHL